MNEPIYKIANWDEHFETSETGKLKSLSWVPTPNKHDGFGFPRLAAEKDAGELFAAWNLILQIPSKGKPGSRGLLARDGVALSAADAAAELAALKQGCTEIRSAMNGVTMVE